MEYSMRKNGIRLLLTLALLLAAGALVSDIQLDKLIAERRAEQDLVDRSLALIADAMAELRSAQTAYVAAGQGPDFWTSRVTQLSDRLSEGVTRARQDATSAEAQTRLGSAATALNQLFQADRRAREYLGDDQRLLASDVIFVEAIEASQLFSSDVAAAREAEAAVADARLRELALYRMAGNSAGTVLPVVLALGAVRLSRQRPASEAATMAQMLRDLPPPVKLAPPAPAAAQPPVRITPAASPAVNLPDAAELCVDLARVMDARDIPVLLERAAGVLEAKGLIVWVTDTAGTSLQPLLTHGYSDRVINRLGSLGVDADNVTSLAFRSVRPQLMNGSSAAASGALAVPLVTAAGCTGVLAAEVRETRPNPDTLAVARIVAAQLATIIAPHEISSTSPAAAEA
jgi:hypothetical protein